MCPRGVVLLKTRHCKTEGNRDSKFEGKTRDEARSKSKTGAEKARKARDASKRESS